MAKQKKEVQVMKILDFGVFPGKLMFSHGFSYDEIMDQLIEQKCDGWAEAISKDKELFDNSQYTASYRIVEKKGEHFHFYFIILQKQFQFTDYDYCVLAHEVLHICQFFLPDILDRNREIEAEAYLHTHLMKQCLSAIRGNEV